MNNSTQSSLSGGTRRSAVHVLFAGLASSLGLAAPQLAAQPGPPAHGFGLSDVAATYSFSSAGDLEQNGKLGTVEVSHFEFETGFSLPAPETWRLGASLSWSRDEFTLTGAIPLPKKLESLGFNFTAMKDLADAFGPGWSAMVMLNPSFASDTTKLSGDSFSLMAIAAVEREVSKNLSWNLGVVGMSRGDTKVIPMLGVRWRFAPEWELAFGFPRTGVSYQVNEALSLSAGVNFHGGTYYVSKAPAAGLGDTYLDYQEIRAGLGAEYQFGQKLSLVVEGGMTIDRTFDYYDRGIKLDGKSASYGRFGLRYRF